MEYRELQIQTDREHLELLEAELTGSGFTSMMIDDPEDIRDILEHPDVYKYDYVNDALEDELKEAPDRQPVITLYFGDDEEGAAEMRRAAGLLKALSEGSDGMPLSFREEQTGDDSEWLYKWQEHFKPVRVGGRITVKPSWEDYEASEKELVIEMDPGMAFGSGLHETTSMCIRALEMVLCGDGGLQGTARTETGEGGEPAGLRILDVGTGTGILAIAGVLLGADEALGIDIDPDAVRVARENIERNGLADSISAQYGDLTEGVDYRADIIVANLMADLVMKLSPAAAEHLDRGGWYITSGILDVKEEVVAEAIENSGFRVCEVLHDGEWCAVIAVKEQ